MNKSWTFWRIRNLYIRAFHLCYFPNEFGTSAWLGHPEEEAWTKMKAMLGKSSVLLLLAYRFLVIMQNPLPLIELSVGRG